MIMLKNLLAALTSRIGRTLRIVLGLVLILGGTTLAVLFRWCRVYVPPGKCLVRIAKFGNAPPPDRKVVDPGEKGIQRETWGPGRYFLNPISWDTEIRELVEIRPGDPSTWKWVHTTSDRKSTR